jgi:uncharacterized protein
MQVRIRCNLANALGGLPAAAVLVFILAAPGLAATSQPAPPPTVLHLSQTAKRRLPRDLLHVELRAEKTASSPEVVEAAINRGMAKALAEARQVNGVEIETGSYAVYRVMHEKNAPEWTGAQSLRLSGSDFAALLKLAGALEAEGLVMSDLTYEASPKTVHGAEDALTSEALSALAARAAAIAQQLHLKVNGYRDVTVGNAQAEGGPIPRFAAMAEATMPAPVGAPGEATVRVTVSAEILLAPAR